MMRPVGIYFLLCSNKVEWTSSVHRDLDEVLAALEDARRIEDAVGFVHVGTSRPPNSAFAKVASSLAGCVVLTTSARWVFDYVGTYSDVVAYVDGLGLHIALSGWGHANFDSSDIAYSNQTACNNENKGFGSPWLAYCDQVDPEGAQKAWLLGIHDDVSYHAKEQTLDWGTRRALGIVRMEYLMRTRDFDNPIQVATCCPPWLIDTQLGLINTTVRCGNALRSTRLVYVADLLHMTVDDLLKIPNFGRKSLTDLAKALRTAVQNGPNRASHDMETHKPLAIADGAPRFAIAHGWELDDNSVNRPASDTSFRLAFENNKSRLRKNQSMVLSQRIGSDGEKMTLAEVGENIGTTRERVRQIEAAAIEIFRADPIWQMELAARLDKILQDREDPLPAQSLGIFDPWFSDIEHMLSELEFILDRILDNQFYILEINGCRFVTRLSKADWRKAVREGSMLLEHAAEDNSSKAEARLRIEEILSSKGSELASELWAAVQTVALFAKDEHGVEKVVGVGSGAESLVAAVLATSDRPLHFTELPRRILDAYGRSIEVRRAHSAASNVGLLLGRGTFGSIRHCPLSPEEIDVLRQETEDIVLSGSKGRQWSCSELAEQLGDRALDFEERVDHYVVHIALKGSSVLSNLGRFVWAQSGERPTGTHDRIDICQATLSVLQSTGRPMTRNEVRVALLRDRGLTGNFQIHSRGSLVRTGVDCWGILERDIPLSHTEIRDVCSSAAALLERDQHGIHLTEIRHRLSDVAPATLHVSDPYAMFSVLLTDRRFKTSMGGYIYLTAWEGPRRLSQADAVLAALRNLKGHGATASEIAKQATQILGRPIERENVYSAMVSNGATFDEEANRWTLHEESEGESEIDEGAGIFHS